MTRGDVVVLSRTSIGFDLVDNQRDTVKNKINLAVDINRDPPRFEFCPDKHRVEFGVIHNTAHKLEEKTPHVKSQELTILKNGNSPNVSPT